MAHLKDEGGRMKDEAVRGDTGAVRDLRERTKRFALRIIRLYGALPKSAAAQVIGKQVLRSGTSVGAQYREAFRSRSNAELASKVEGALQEIEETSYWLELLSESAIVSPDRLQDLRGEAEALTAILVVCANKAKAAAGRN